MKWTENQLQAINKSGSNIIVSAGAGSGKTAVLSERVLRIINEGTDIRNILILTFTNEAAGEMKERIRKKLKKSGLKKALAHLDEASITTFDAYALSLVKKYHYLFNISKNIDIIDSSIISLEKERILDEIFTKYYDNKDEKFLHFLSDLTNRDDDNIKAAILKISSNMDLKYDKEKYLNSYIENFYNKEHLDSLFNEYFIYIKDLCTEIEEDVYLLKEHLDDKNSEKLDTLKAIFKPNKYEDIYNNRNISLPTFKNLEEDAKIVKENLNKHFKELIDLVSYSKEETINNLYITKDYVLVIINIIKELDDKINDYKKAKNAFEFNDIAKMAIRIVDENLDIRKELQNKYTEIMIDEYQDTSDLQEKFISLIENNNLYMVGDIKQSIYRFRNANPDIFKSKYENYSKSLNGEKIDLLKNFRSREEVLDNINEIFKYLMVKDIGGIDYKDKHEMIYGNLAYKEKGSTNNNYNMKLLSYCNDDKLYSNLEIEAFTIAKDIKEKINNNYQVFDFELNSLRNIKYSDFCIILDRNTDMDTYKKIFEYSSLPLEIYKDENLTSENDILIIKNILSLILAIKNKEYDNLMRYYFTSIARSFLYNLSDKEIFKYLENNNFYDSEIYKKCYRLSLNISMKTPRVILDEILEEFSFYENIIKIGNIKSALIRLDYLEELSSNVSSLGFTITDFRDYLEEMIKTNKEIRYKETSEKENCIKIMNIHKSKGLEFPICYFAGLYKKFNIKDISSRILYDHNYGILTPYFKEGIGGTFLKTLIKNKYYKDEVSEKVRLFYVALTRAKEEIIMVLPEFKEENNRSTPIDYITGVSFTSFYDFLNAISYNLKKYIIHIDLKGLNLNKNYENSKISKQNIPKSNKKLIIKENSIKSNIIETAHASKNIHDLLSIEDQEKMDYGTKIHNKLELSNLKKKSKDNVINNLQNTFDFNKAIIYQELEFIYNDKDKEYNGIIDLMLEYDNEIKIIDYKLKNISDDAYINQLTIYYNYIKNISNKKIKVYLYSILNNELKEINM